MNEIEKNALEFARDYFKKFSCGHDFEHIERVYQNAKNILMNEKEADSKLVLLSAILHDIDDEKLVCDADSRSYKNTRFFLQSQNVSQADIEKIIKIISTVSMKEYLNGNRPETLEAKIVFDADKLDQIGAIAIARSFAYGAKHGRKIFDSQKMPTHHYEGKYPDGYASSMNYILEVLVNVKSMLYTKTAKQMAQKRHNFMIGYLTEFFEEENNKEWSDYFFSNTRYWSTGNSSD